MDNKAQHLCFWEWTAHRSTKCENEEIVRTHHPWREIPPLSCRQRRRFSPYPTTLSPRTSTTTVTLCHSYDVKAARFINQGEKGRRQREPLTVELLIIIQRNGRARSLARAPSLHHPRAPTTTTYASALTLLSPRHSPAGGPEIANAAAPISAQFYSPLCLARSAIDFQPFRARDGLRICATINYTRAWLSATGLHNFP